MGHFTLSHTGVECATHGGAMSLTLCIKPIEIGAQTHCVYQSKSMLLEWDIFPCEIFYSNVILVSFAFFVVKK